MKRSNGFILVEFLVATVLFSLAGSGLYAGFSQGIRAEKRIQAGFKVYDPFRILFLRLDQDLRNTVSLKDYPFEGNEKEISFPVLLEKESSNGKGETRLVWVRYMEKDGVPIRTEVELTPNLKKEKPSEKILMRNLKSLAFGFPYEDEKENRLFESFWLKEPYYGIPRGVKVNVSTGDLSLTKIISIPQGRVTHVQAKDK